MQRTVCKEQRPSYATSFARRLATAFFCGVAGFVPMLAGATTCGDLHAMRVEANETMARLVAEYPGTHVVIGLCAAAASSEYQQTRSNERALGTFATCAILGCAMAGFDNCTTVTREWFIQSMKVDQIQKAIRDNGC